ncbi:hypothetical protein C4577_05110 [Candidatus Parcubacteria bacterium]|nr:MAG: hypothetical protein C4577_05110 [Candidatus Parcubacteria bacterium]
MTEELWLTSNGIEHMVRFLTSYMPREGEQYFELFRGIKVSFRKLRLYCKAIAKHHYDLGHVIHLDSMDQSEPQLLIRDVEFWNRACSSEKKRPIAANLLRHIVGSPYRPPGTTKCEHCKGEGQFWEFDKISSYKHYMIPPGHYEKCYKCDGKSWIGKDYPKEWPSKVLQLAETINNGEQCGFALRDELLDLGQPDLAEHFIIDEGQHPEGCWAVDFILGKE